MSVVELTKDNFDQEVMMAQEPVLIDFWASWCGPCQMQGPIVEDIAETYTGKVKVCKVNVDEDAKLALDYGIMNIPTLVFMKQGQFRQKMIGLQSKENIIEVLDSLQEA